MMNKRITKTIICLSLSMFFLILVPILMVQATQAKRLVIIDAAHGGADAGVMVTDKIQEKEVTLILAQLLQKELAKSPDIQTQFTRTSDKTISNAERVKIVKAASG